MRSLLMIPGPVEVSPAVREAHDVVPPSHTAPDLIAAYGEALELTLEVWSAAPNSQPFIIPGSGTTAMELAAGNLIRQGKPVLVVNTGYFSQRMMEIARRYGADVHSVDAEPGFAPSPDEIEAAVKEYGPEIIFATHVDTSTGVRMDPRLVVDAADGALTVFDGVCATAAEPFDMAALGADVYLTGSQKALGLPAGLAVAVFSSRAIERRREVDAPPLYLDIESWQPIMDAYREGRPSYFATPATNLVLAARVGLREIVETRFDGTRGMAARSALHRYAADAMRTAWEALGLDHLAPPELRGVTLCALKVPAGVESPVPPAIARHGVSVAGGLYPGLQKTYFRVGHMGHCVTQLDMLERTVQAVAMGLNDLGGAESSPDEAVAVFRERFEDVACVAP